MAFCSLVQRRGGGKHPFNFRIRLASDETVKWWGCLRCSSGISARKKRSDARPPFDASSFVLLSHSTVNIYIFNKLHTFIRHVASASALRDIETPVSRYFISLAFGGGCGGGGYGIGG